MKKIYAKLLLGTLVLLPSVSFANEGGIDAAIDRFFQVYLGWFPTIIFSGTEVNGVSVPYIVGWLAIAALIFTVYFGFIQFRTLGLSLDIIKGKYSNPDGSDPGEISHFKAFATAVSGTVGLGNIAGVGAALAIGGPGATFWKIVVGLLGMASKFVECTLGVKYRDIREDGTVLGGPMRYLSKGLAEMGYAGFGKFLAAGFAVMVIFGSIGGGNMFQANQATVMLEQAFGIADGYSWVIGVLMAMFVGSVIIGGVPSIASVTSKLVPIMAITYIGMSIIILLVNFSEIPAALAAIFTGAFSPEGVTGGIVGALIQGMKRATFSNEAGIGSASIAHSAVKTKEPATEGLVALLEPFLDTVIICTMTALVITISGLNTVENVQTGALMGVSLTSAAYMNDFAFFEYILTAAIVMFAVSTMISWAYYGIRGWTYLFGDTQTQENIFKVIFCLFVIVGASISFGAVIDFSDAAIFAMGIFNIVGLYMLMPKVKEEVNSFIARVNSGEIKKYVD